MFEHSGKGMQKDSDCLHQHTTYNTHTQRALEVWGSWQVLEHQLERRRVEAEAEEQRRKGSPSVKHSEELLDLH